MHTPGQVNMRQPLTRYRLQKILNVREHDMLESDPPATLQALEEYAEGTASQLLQLQVVTLSSTQMHMQFGIMDAAGDQNTCVCCAARGSGAAGPRA
jgi:hypothetical protein